MASYSERKLRYARPIACAIRENPAFLKWLVAGTTYENSEPRLLPGDLQRSLKNPKMKNPYWFNYWCGRDFKQGFKMRLPNWKRDRKREVSFSAERFYWVAALVVQSQGVMQGI